MRKLYIATVGTLIIVCSMTAHAQWTRWIETNGPFGGSVQSATSLHDTLFVVADGLKRSTNGGVSWQSIQSTVRSLTSANGTAAPKRISRDSLGGLVATSDNDVLRSRDGGESWVALDSTYALNPSAPVVGADGSIFRIAGTTLYMLAPGSMRSRVVGFGCFTNAIERFAIGSDGSAFAMTAANRVYSSSDYGVSWRIARNGGDTTFPKVNVLVVLGNVLVAGTDSGLSMSRDDGATWEMDTSSIRERQITCVLEHDGMLYVGTRLFGVFRSSDFGSTWTELTSGLDDPDVNVLAAVGNGMLLAGTNGAVHLLSRGDTTWRWMSNGMRALSVGRIEISANGDVFAPSAVGIFRTRDRGAHWLAVNNGLHQRSVQEVCSDSPTELLALTYDNHLCRSTNGGDAWTTVGSVAGWDYVFGLSVDHAANYFLIGAVGYQSSRMLLRSTDRGVSWQQVLEAPSLMTTAVSADGSVLARSYYDGVYRSSNNGETWSQVVGPNSIRELSALVTDARGGVFALSRDYLCRSGDNGITWEFAPTVLRYGGDLAVSRDGVLIATHVDNGNRARRSFDRGNTWSDISYGLPSAYGIAIAPDGIAYVGGTGVSRTEESVTGVRTEHNPPSQLHISPLHPHPLVGQSSVEITIPSTTYCVLKAFDLAGSEIATLYAGTIEKGTHKFDVRSDLLASGAYLLYLWTPSGSTERTFVTVKR